MGLKDLHIKELLINRLAPKITSVTSYKMNQHHLLREGVCARVCVCMCVCAHEVIRRLIWDFPLQTSKHVSLGHRLRFVMKTQAAGLLAEIRRSPNIRVDKLHFV